MQSAGQTLRIVFRQLYRSPAFAATAVLTLALGIGANTAIFSLVNQALLSSLPVQDPDRLVVLQGTGTKWQGRIIVTAGTQESYFSYPAYKELRDRNQVLSGMGALASVGMNLARSGGAAQLAQGEIVSGNYFDVLGVRPAAGRLLSQGDDGQPLSNPVAVLSYDFWKSNFGGDGSVLNTTVSVNGFPFQIVGVAAQNFHSAVWGQTPALFVPMSMLGQVVPGQGARLTEHGDRWVSLFGRLKKGQTAESAQVVLAPTWHSLRADELAALGTRSDAFVADFLTNSRLLALSGARGFSFNRDDLRTPLFAIMGIALLVLLIAAVNVASLLLVRAAARTREFALRSALGASFAIILKQLLLEGLVLGLLGGTVGLFLAPLALRTLVNRMAIPDSGTTFDSTIDLPVLLFNFCISVFVSVCFSLVPALQLRRMNLSMTLREGRATGSGGILSLRRLIVCMQVGLSVLLLIASGLFLRTLEKLREVNVGFNTTHLVTFGIDPILAGYQPDQVPALHRQILDTLSGLPGVQAATATDDPELADNNLLGHVTVAGYQSSPDDSAPVEFSTVAPTYLNTLQIPLIAGRAFNDQDTVGHPRVAVVNRAFAERCCGSAEACLGRQVTVGSNPLNPSAQIVGVARNAHHAGVRSAAAPTMYRSLLQLPDHAAVQFYVRTNGDPTQMLESTRRAMHDLNPALSLSGLMTMDQQIDRNLTSDRVIALLSATFGVLATILAGVGIYGVLAFSTAQRTREIGIRMALGSTRLAASMLIVIEVLRLTAVGVFVAVPTALALGILLRTQLYNVSSTDPFTVVSAVGLITLVALLAAFVPARRAASINPTEALRLE